MEPEFAGRRSMPFPQRHVPYLFKPQNVRLLVAGHVLRQYDSGGGQGVQGNADMGRRTQHCSYQPLEQGDFDGRLSRGIPAVGVMDTVDYGIS